MTTPQPANLAASVHRRLLNQSRLKGDDFNFLLTRYAIERLLYRLSKSQFADQFVLKGALLFTVWSIPGHRPTRDVDLLGYGSDSVDRLRNIFEEVFLTSVEPDGIDFDSPSLTIQPIRDDQAYGGQRITVGALLGKARISTRIDIGFGDAVVPEAVSAKFPTLLDFPAPFIRTYPPETVIAEKVHAMVMLDMSNSRMKDFYNVWVLSRLFEFDATVMARAIRATFERRNSLVPTQIPVALTATFSEHPDKVIQWNAFTRRNRIDVETKFSQVVDEIAQFVTPIITAATQREELQSTWIPGSGWDRL